MAKLGSYGGIIRALAERNYRIYTIGSSVSLVGLWTQRIAIGWLTWQLTESETWLGLIAFADLFPTVVLTPVAGVLADRIDRLRMMVVTQILAMLQSIALTVLTFLDVIEIWSLLFLAAFLGVVMSFNVAARLALMASISSRENLPAAIALNAGLFNLARFLGPAVGGFIIVGWDVGAAFAFNSLTFITTIVALFMLRDLRLEATGPRKGGLLKQMGEGLGYALKHPGIGPMLIVITAIAFGVKPFLDLLPAISDVIYARGANGLAQLMSAGGLGALVAAVWVAQRGSVKRMTTIATANLVIAGLAIILLASTDFYWLGLVCAFVAGGAMTVCGTGTQTLMQNAVDGAMRGRVMSLYGVIFRGAPALGSLVMGIASETVGLQAVLLSGGILVLGIWACLWPRRRVTEAALEQDMNIKLTAQA